MREIPIGKIFVLIGVILLTVEETIPWYYGVLIAVYLAGIKLNIRKTPY